MLHRNKDTVIIDVEGEQVQTEQVPEPTITTASIDTRQEKSVQENLHPLIGSWEGIIFTGAAWSYETNLQVEEQDEQTFIGRASFERGRFCQGSKFKLIPDNGNRYSITFTEGEYDCKGKGKLTHKGDTLEGKVRLWTGLTVKLIKSQTSYQSTQTQPNLTRTALIDQESPLDGMDALLIGTWRGEFYLDSGHPWKTVNLKINTMESQSYVGTASIKEPSARRLDCEDGKVQLERYAENMYFVTFSGRSCEGEGKLKIKDKRLHGRAKFSGTRVTVDVFKVE